MLYAQEPLDIDDVEQVPLGDFTYQWRNICDRTPLHGKCRIILSYRSYTIAHFNKDGILDGLYEKYEDNHLVQKLTYVKGILRGKGYEYYTDGTVKKECVWNEQGKIDGLMIEYNRIGRTEWDYKNGEVDGQQRTFDNNGRLITFVSYSKGMQHGPFRIYEEGGTDMPPFIREGYAWGWRGKKGEYKETWALSGKPKCIEHYTEKGEKTGQMGQVVVKNGIVQVKKLILKYTFVPKEWNFITFPSDLDIDKISDLNAKGYYLNNKTSGRGAYYIRSYDTQVRAENPSGSVWKNLETPEVKGLRGYIMGINNALGMDPVEVTFTMDNVSLDFESSIRPLNLTLDLSQVEPGTRQDVYIKPVNVKGNTLKVSVDFQPEDLSVLPVNHAKALEGMLFTFTPDKRGIRLTLPDQTPAKIAIYNKKGTKLMKAVRYVAPMVLDLSDLKSGTYQMVINYGDATAVRILDF